MKKLLIGLMAAVMLVAAPTVTFAQSWSSDTWLCHAESNYAWGEGISTSQRIARRIALNECAKRTPYYDTCVVISCE